ncbi:hypothetical protein BpHYR1_036708 [Brachionus plicatilis]|uniref:Uncharacterized protein n=1 Tax=Brachionus plicatilis TaxID=10195 RepID=A0A3M7QYD9_BRAPC|nr:hypothetical protein BpHYR1_036708 [Brachionus plicatilis]
MDRFKRSTVCLIMHFSFKRLKIYRSNFMGNRMKKKSKELVNLVNGVNFAKSLKMNLRREHNMKLVREISKRGSFSFWVWNTKECNRK